MKAKALGTYRPVRKDDKKITKRERRLGRVVVTKQQNYKGAEHTANLRAEAEKRDKALSPDSPKRKRVRVRLKG